MRTDRPKAPAASRHPFPRVASTRLARETAAGPVGKRPFQRIERRIPRNEAPGAAQRGVSEMARSFRKIPILWRIAAPHLVAIAVCLP